MLQTAWIKRNQCHRNWLAHPDIQWVGVPIWIQAHKIQRWATGQTIREANDRELGRTPRSRKPAARDSDGTSGP
jgi:hypothetical protein